MGLRFRIWLPVSAVLIVLLSIVMMFLYGVPSVKARLNGYSQGLTIEQAAAAANAVSTGGEDVQNELSLSAMATGGEAIAVDPQGRIEARAGSAGGFVPSDETLRTAAAGRRMFERRDGLNVAVVPVVREGKLAGGVVFATDEPENTAYRLFLRSGVEAALVASVLGGGLMLLLAAFLSRRVERLTLGARAIEQGDLSSRIEPGFGDELGDLAKSFNAMAERLELSFSRLEETSETQNTILDNLTEGVLATGLEGGVVFANRVARSVLGLEDGQFPARLPNPWEDFDLPEAVARCARERRCDEARVQKDETFLRVNLEHLPAFDDHRGGVLVVIQDLSEGRRLEANQQRFLANAAHELKTPITSILGAADLLLTEEKDDPRVRNRFLTHIRSEAERMQRLSETLLKLARTGWDLRDPNFEAVDLGAVAKKTAGRMRPLAQSAGLTLSVEGRDARVRADAEWLEQALLVLVSNAMQHSHRGGQVRLRLDGGTVAVQDEGEGVRSRDLPHVFERFYQGEGSSGGFGLGLPICKELVERMGGKISLRSEAGEGTRAEIELPEVGDVF